MIAVVIILISISLLVSTEPDPVGSTAPKQLAAQPGKKTSRRVYSPSKIDRTADRLPA